MASRLRFIIESSDKSSKGTKSAEKNLDGLVSAAKKAGLAMAAAFGAEKIKDLTRLGAVAERAEDRFNALAKSAGGAEAIFDAFQRGAGGAADKLTIFTSSSKLLQMGLVDSAASMERVVEMATRLGDQTMGVSDRVADFAAMLANQSTPRLDNFGMSSGKVRARIAELQDQFKGMSRETAFLTAAMESGDEALERLGPRADDNLASFEKLEAEMADLQVTIGQALLPAAVELVKILSEVVKVVAPIVVGFGELTASAVKLAKGFDDTTEALAGWGAEVEAMLAGGESLSDVMGELAGRYLEAKRAMDEGGIVADVFINQQKELVKIAEEARDVAADNASTYESYEAAIRSFNDVAGDTAGHILTQAEAQEKANAIMRSSGTHMTKAAALAKVYAENTVIMTRAEFEHAKAIQARNEALGELGLNVARLAQDAAEMTTSTWEASRATVDLTDKQHYLTEAAESSDTAMLGYLDAMQKGVIASDAHGAAIARSYAATQAAGEAADAARARSDAAAQAFQDQAAAMRDQAAAAAEAAGQTANLAISMKDATEAKIAEAMIGMLDPEAMGAEAFMIAATDIGVQFGIMDEKSIALAENLPRMAEAIETGVVPAQDAGEAMGIFVDALDRGESPMAAVLGHFEKAPTFIGPTAEGTEKLGELMAMLGDDAAPKAKSGMSDFSGAADDASGSLEDLLPKADQAKSKMDALAGTYTVTIKYVEVGRIPHTPSRMQFGGVVPGRIGEPVPIIAHGGELFLNPHQPGALGGPGGPQVTNYNSYGGNSYRFDVNNELAAAVVMRELERRERSDRLNRRM